MMCPINRPMTPLEDRPELPPTMKWSDLCEVEMLARPHWRVLYTNVYGAEEELHTGHRKMDQDTPEGAADYAWTCWERMTGMKRPQTAKQRQEWAQEWCERHIELEYDDVMAGLVAAMGVEGNVVQNSMVEWLKETRDSGHEFSKEDVNAYAIWGDLADEIDELMGWENPNE